MAAISVLPNHEDTSLRPKDDEAIRSPSTSKSIVRVRSPKPSDIATIPYEEPHDADSDSHTTTGPVRGVSPRLEDQVSVPRSDDKSQLSEVVRSVDSADEKDDSEDDDQQGEEGSGNRTKKSQRFFCTGYPPCNLSFTRSEHLARHIRYLFKINFAKGLLRN